MPIGHPSASNGQVLNDLTFHLGIQLDDEQKLKLAVNTVTRIANLQHRILITGCKPIQPATHTSSAPPLCTAISKLADQLGSQLDNEEKLETAVCLLIQTAWEYHQVVLFTEHSPNSTTTRTPSAPSQTSGIVIQNATPSSAHVITQRICQKQPPPTFTRARLLSPTVARNRYSRMLQACEAPDDSSVYSEFLSLSDWDSEWDREAATAQFPTRQAPWKITQRPASNIAKPTQPQGKTIHPALPTPPPSDEAQPVSSPLHPSANKKSPLKSPFVYHPPAFILGDTYSSARPRSNSISSTASSSSCSSNSTNPPPPTSSALSSIPDYQHIQAEERRRKRAHRAAKQGLPAPPLTPPPLPQSTSFPTARGHTIPGRDVETKKRKASEFLGNHGKLGQDKPPHKRKAMRLEISETPVVDELWHPSAALPYGEKDHIINSLADTIGKRSRMPSVTEEIPWCFKFELVPPKTASRRIQKIRHSHDFSIQSVKGAGLRAKLASVFSIVPYDSKKARAHLEKQLEPLVVANRSRFKQLELNPFWKKWKDWEVVVQ